MKLRKSQKIIIIQYLCTNKAKMSPTILLAGRYRFFFNSREETRMHVHVATSDGTAKIWLEPVIALTEFYNLDSADLKEIVTIVEDHKDEFIEKWNRHFGM